VASIPRAPGYPGSGEVSTKRRKAYLAARAKMTNLLERAIVEIEEMPDPDERAAAEPWRRQFKAILEAFGVKR
jgi:hypothetical protein